MKKILSRAFRLIKRIGRTVLPLSLYERLRSWFFRVFVFRNKKISKISYPNLQQGVNLFIYCMNNSAGIEGHLLELALEDAQIPYNVIDLSAPEKFKEEMKGKPLYNVNLIVCHAASKTHEVIRLFGLDLKRHYNICYWSWELSEVPDEYCAWLSIFQEVWTLSAFCTSALEKKAAIPVLTVPLYANPDVSVIKNGRDYYNIDQNAFLFMLAYDCNSFVARKNPQAAVQAYMKAFSPQESSVGLVLKLAYPDYYKDHILEIKKMLELYPNIYFIDKYLSDVEMRTLIQLSDTYVSLHRSEGFGLVPLEAMALGTPVICTAWSGNMEYMTHMNAALVGYQMVPVEGRYVGSYPGDGLVWADPDVNEASAHMRRMISDQAWRESLIANGKYTAESCYGVANISKIMRNRLERLKMI